MGIPKRMTAKMEGSFCVFLIGMRINRSWKMHKWLPVFLAMPRMLTELRRQPDLGFIGGDVWFGRTILLLQYWQSFGALIRYAKNSDLAHLPAWARFRDNIGDSGDVGSWHETYLISEGHTRVFITICLLSDSDESVNWSKPRDLGSQHLSGSIQDLNWIQVRKLKANMPLLQDFQGSFEHQCF
jgi:hypothetical protein